MAFKILLCYLGLGFKEIPCWNIKSRIKVVRRIISPLMFYNQSKFAPLCRPDIDIKINVRSQTQAHCCNWLKIFKENWRPVVCLWSDLIFKARFHPLDNLYTIYIRFTKFTKCYLIIPRKKIAQKTDTLYKWHIDDILRSYKVTALICFCSDLDIQVVLLFKHLLNRIAFLMFQQISEN